MKKFFLYNSIFLLMVAGFYACDSTTAPEDKFSDSPTITHFDVSPKEINFSAEEHGFVDTTINIFVDARVRNLNSSTIPLAVLSDKSTGEIIAEESLTITDIETGLYSATFNLETKTTSFAEYIVNLIFSEESMNYAQSYISVYGVSNNIPVILEANNPETFQRPQSGSRNVVFTAKVTDQDGYDTIEGVFLRLISQISGEVASSPFQLFDNGVSQGDEIAQDSIFTLTFPVSSTNRPETYDIHYYAVDKGGLVSDTVKTTFSIVE